MTDTSLHTLFYQLLREELVPALGCTEPIAIAYAAAVAAQHAGGELCSIEVQCSGNIIKNVKSVVVPNSENMRGIEAAALLGALGGDPEKKLEVLASVRKEHIDMARKLEAQGTCRVSLLEGRTGLFLRLTLVSSAHTVSVTICDNHTNIIRIEKDGDVIYTSGNTQDQDVPSEQNRSWLSLRSIYEFAQTADMARLKPLLEPQWRYNLAISEEGLSGRYGAQVGRTLMTVADDDLFTRIRAAAAAGSDARMNGCTMPVVINSGSGNQGITVAVPVILYGLEKGLPEEKIYRALALANLVAIYQKTGIGCLSAYCGAVSAAVGSAAGITWLSGGDLAEIESTVVNGIAIASGIVCDGAKASCAAKIATALSSALLAHQLAMKNHAFHPGDGIVKSSVDQTVATVGRLGREGMRETDLVILDIMMQ